MAIVNADGGSHSSADSQPKSVVLVCELAAAWQSVCIHQVNSLDDFVMMTAAP